MKIRPLYDRIVVKRLEEKDGNVLFQSKLAKQRVIHDTTAFEVHSCLSEVLEWGTGDKAFSKYGCR